MFAIFKRELKSYFLTPSAYIFMSTFLFITGLIYTSLVVFSKSSLYADFLGNIIFVFIIEVPLLTMRVFSEEKKNRTDQLLLTTPVTPIEIVLGKFFAPLVVFLITVFITFLYPILISFHGDLKVVQIVGSYIGFILLGTVLISIGIFVSSLTENIASAAIMSFCAILFLWIIDLLIPIMPSSPLAGAIFILILLLSLLYTIYKSSGKLLIPFIGFAALTITTTLLYLFKNTLFTSLIPKIFGLLSITTRFNYFPLGVIRLTDIVFYISVTLFMIYLTALQIEKRRWSKGE